MPRDRDDELQREIRAHLELEAEERVAEGLSPEAARDAARRAFGNVTRTREDVRAVWTWIWIEHAWQDLRQTLGGLRRTPGFTAIAVITLGLGMGATTAVFSAVDALLVRPLPVASPDHLYVVRRAGETRARFRAGFYRALNESSRTFSSTLATFTFPVVLADAETGTRARAAFVTLNYFDVLGVGPQRGRLFRSEGDLAVAVISHRFWRERFAGRESIVGESVRIGGAPFVIVGVTPPGFEGLQLAQALDLWIPMSATQEAIQIPPFRTAVDIVGRLAAGVSPAVATSQVGADYQRWLESSAPVSERAPARAIVLRSASHGLESEVREQFRSSLSLLVAICACLWVMTLVNVSALLAARLRERARDIGVQLALGATSARLFVQLLGQATVLVSGGVLLGVLLAAAAGAAIPHLMPSWEGVDVRVSPLVLIATAITAAMAAVVVTVAQSLSIDRRRLVRYLVPNPMASSGRRYTFSTCLVGSQLALTLPLMVAAALLVQSFHRLGNVDTGFARTDLVQVQVEPLLVGYSAERARAYYTALIDRLRTIPGISDATVSNGGALTGFGGVVRLRHDGVSRSGGTSVPFDVDEEVTASAIGEGYFRTLGIRIVAGRPFDGREAQSDAKVAIVNVALARRVFGDEERAVGQVLTLGGGRAADSRVVVGVAANTIDANLREPATAIVYLPVGGSALLVVHVRTATDPAELIPAIRQAAASLDPNVPILRVETIDSRRRGALQRERLLAVASTTIGWLALALSAVGLFGLISNAVGSRTREIGIRTALGARRKQIAGLFLKETSTMLVFGGLAGLGTAVALSRLLQGLLYGISATDLMTYAGATGVLVVVAMAATVVPLRRACGVGILANLRDP